MIHASDVLFRNAHPTDAKLLYDAWGHHAPNFERLTAAPFQSVSDAQGYLDKLFAAPGSFALHIVVEEGVQESDGAESNRAEPNSTPPKSTEPTGTVVGLVKAVVQGHRALVGYVVHEPYWGRGLATRAVREMVARLGRMAEVQRVWATCALDNPGSVRVLEKCGFEREGVLRQWVVYPALGTEAVDNYSYVLSQSAAGRGSDAGRSASTAGEVGA